MFNRNHLYNRLITNLLLVALALVVLPSFAAAQSDTDLVIVWDADRNQQLKYSGRIIEYTHSHLTIQLPSGREKQIESDRIVDITTAWRSEYREAEELFDEQQYVKAEKGFRRASVQETRGWIKERIQARILWCLRAQGKWSDAADFFSDVLRKSNSNTPYLDTIPLVWHTLRITPGLQGQATQLLSSIDPSERLIGASWLLASPVRSRAIDVLKQLELNSNKQLAILATAQLWRTKLPVTLAADLVKWQKTIDRLPVALQAGPLYVLGQLQNQQQLSEHAILTWMRVVILYPHYHQLNSESLLASIRVLRSLDKTTQAFTLCRELQNEYPGTPAADQASRIMTQLRQEIQAAANTDN